MDRKSVFVQCLPKQQNKQSSFHRHQMAVKEDLVQKLQQRGVSVVADFTTDPTPEVLVLFQSVGRIGDELPFALKELPTDVRERVTAFAVIQDDEFHKVGREVLPPDFQPQHLLDFVVVPGTSQLKDCAANNAVLDQIAWFAGGDPGIPKGGKLGCTATMERKSVFVQCLPIQQNKQDSFHHHQMAVKEDLVQKLKERGVAVVADFTTDPTPEVLVLFQSVGSIGDELPFALQNLPTDVRECVTAFAVIQDDEQHKVRRGVLPLDFQPQHLLDFVVVPGTSRLKDCTTNKEVLDQIAEYVGAVRSTSEPQTARTPPVPPVKNEEDEPARKKKKMEETISPGRSNKSNKTGFVQCLPVQQNKQGSFHRHQMAVKEDLVQKLQLRGVTVEDDFKDTDSTLEVLVLFQSVGRVGDELPCALHHLLPEIRKKVTAFAVIQDDEFHKVGREVLPPDFQPQHLLDFVVVPGTSRLKDCAANNAVLDQIAKYTGAAAEEEAAAYSEGSRKRARPPPTDAEYEEMPACTLL